MKKTLSLSLLVLTLAGCGAPVYISDGAMEPFLSAGTPNGRGGSDRLAEAPQGTPAPAASVIPASGVVALPTPAVTAGKTVKAFYVDASAVVLQVQHTRQLSGTVMYNDGSRDGTITWSSSDETIATVNRTTGMVTGVRAGLATIQARAASDAYRVVNVPITVREGLVADVVATVAPQASSLAPGATLQLEGHIMDSSSGIHPNGRWTSSNQQVAFVNDQGLVIARIPGRATIAFTSAADPTVSARATITVADPGEASEGGTAHASPATVPVDQASKAN